MKRRRIIASFVFVVFIFIVILSQDIESVMGSTDLFEFYISNFNLDTAANNAVAAIYLNYRLFDTFFETLLLVLSVIGIIYFSTHEGEY